MSVLRDGTLTFIILSFAKKVERRGSIVMFDMIIEPALPTV